MHMIRRRNRHRIDRFAHLLEHLAPITILIGVIGAIGLLRHSFERLGLALQSVRIDIANRHNIAPHRKRVRGVAIALPPHADAGHIDTIVRAQDAPNVRERESGSPSSQAGATKESATVENVFWLLVFHNSIRFPLPHRQGTRLRITFSTPSAVFRMDECNIARLQNSSR
jgi:hypothetical protein